jgi:hypothetical protein
MSKIAELIQDPTVSAWFDTLIARQMDEVLLACQRGNESDLRIVGTKMTTIRQLRNDLQALAVMPEACAQPEHAAAMAGEPQ